MIASYYAGVLAIFYIFLALYVVQGRYKHQVGLGDGGVSDLQQRIRMHGNFAEYAPFALLLLYMVDIAKLSPTSIHILGLMLVIGRILHAWGILTSPNASKGRLAGMILTLTMILVCAVMLIWRYIAITFLG